MKKKLLNYLGMNQTSLTVFLVVTFSTSIYWFSGIKSVLYEPFREALGVTNAQLGFLLGLVGFVQIFGYMALGWLQDLVSIRKIIAVDMVGYGAFALVLGLVPNLPYWFLVVAFAAFGFFGDAIYWPTVQKATRGAASDARQAAAFSTQEGIRAAVGIVINSLTLGLFVLGGSGVFGVRIPMVIYPLFMICYSLVVLKFIPKDFLMRERKPGKKTDKTVAFKLIWSAAKLPIVWTTGFGAAGGYLVFVAANTYFLPLIQNVFGLSAGVMGIFGIVNAGVMAIIAAPLSGMLATWKFTSSAQWMAVVYVVIAALSVLMIMVPTSRAWTLPVVIIALLISLCCYAVRAVYYAPIGEYGVPRDKSATAMSIASTLGYSPSFFGFVIFGAILDKYSPEDAYSRVFIIMAVFAVLATVANLIGMWVIRRNGGRSQAGVVDEEESRVEALEASERGDR